MNLSDFQAQLGKSKVEGLGFTTPDTAVSVDVIEKAQFITGAVMNYLQGTSFTAKVTMTDTRPTVVRGLESFSAAAESPENLINGLKGLVEKVAPNASAYQQTAMMETIASSIFRIAGSTPLDVWANASRSVSNNVGARAGLETIMPASMITNIMTPGVIGRESFGVDTDKATPDLRTSISVGIMKFFNSVTGQLFVKKVLSEPMISIKKDDVTVYKMDNSSPDIPMIDLNRDPDQVTVDLIKVIPRKANDTANVLFEDGYIRFDKDVNFMTLSLDASKTAFAAANRTDLIADNVQLSSIVISLTNGTDTEYFELPVPTVNARLSRQNNAKATMRYTKTSFTVSLGKTAVTRSGAASAVLGAIDIDDAILVTVNAAPSLDLKYCNGNILGNVSISAVNKLSASNPVAAATTTAFATMVATNVAAALDARFSEENLRKTNIGAEIVVDTLTYDIPVGKNYFIDYSFTQQLDTDRGTAILVNLINYGLDSRSLKLITDKLDETSIMWENYIPVAGQIFDPGKGYACGNRVRPYAYSGQFDCSVYKNMKEIERIEDIHSAARIQVNAIVNKIDAESYMSRQLTSGMGTYRVVVDPEFLGNILGVAYVHDRLKSTTQAPPVGTINAVLMMDGGTTLEIMTVPFTSMRGKVMGIVMLENSPDSTLNFAVNADMGSVVAHYQSDQNGLKHRLFTNVRELPILTNPTGFLLDVIGMDIETHL